MAYNILVRNTVKILESDHEEDQRIEHLIGKTGLAVVPHHTNANRFLVPVTLFGMSAIHLFFPSGPNLDLAHRFSARPVVDQKIVAHAVVPTPVKMQPVNVESTPLVRRRVVNHDMRPARRRIKWYIGPRAPRVRDQKLHPLLDLSGIRKFIDAHDGRAVHAISLANSPDRVIGPHFMINVMRSAGRGRKGRSNRGTRMQGMRYRWVDRW